MKVSLIAAVAGLALIAGPALAQLVGPPNDQAIAAHMDELAHDRASPVIGDPKAPVTIVEFFDYTCPYCKATEPRLEALVKGDRKVRLVLKEFPILTPASLTAARAGLAAARQGKYAAYHETLMNFRGVLTDAVVYATAKKVGCDLARLRRDMVSPAVSDEIIANFNLARALRLFQTPAFVVGRHFMTGDSADIDFPRAVAAAKAGA